VCLNSETLNYKPANHKESTLALFVAGIGTNNPDHALAADDLSMAAKSFDGSLDSHDFAPVS